MTRDATLFIRIEPALKARLLKRAQAENRTLSNYVEWALEQWLNKETKKKPPPAT